MVQGHIVLSSLFIRFVLVVPLFGRAPNLLQKFQADISFAGLVALVLLLAVGLDVFLWPRFDSPCCHRRVSSDSFWFPFG